MALPRWNAHQRLRWYPMLLLFGIWTCAQRERSSASRSTESSCGHCTGQIKQHGKILPAKAKTTPSFWILSEIELGRRLFLDSTLSRDSSISCATCHSPFRAFTEPRAISQGIGAGARIRNAPSLINVALHHPPFDWDGRAETLEQQLLGVFAADGDMGIDPRQMIQRIRADSSYAAAFRAVNGRSPDIQAAFDAIVAFEKSLVVDGSRFDRFYLGGDSTAFSRSEKRGWRLFRGSVAGCAGCHTPVPDPKSGMILFQDYRFHNLGIGYQHGQATDAGRFHVTHRPTDQGAFRTPSLRNVALTPPYMHDGSLATLEDVVDFYASGGICNPNRDVIMGKRALTTQDRADLVAFLRTLTTEWLGDSAMVTRRLLLAPEPEAINSSR